MGHTANGLRLIPVLVGIAACADGISTPRQAGNAASALDCSIPRDQILNGGPGKDGIPALTDPLMVGAEEAGTEYLQDTDRVVGFVLDGQAMAIPLNIFWWHEIVNLRGSAAAVVITHCPLTGSSLGFDRGAAGGAEFGVSGLLYQNNLIMYDRSGAESLWPQMLRGARCGSKDGTFLESFAVTEMRWEAWRREHPETLVVSSETGWPRDYRRYPYGNYDAINNRELLFPQTPIDGRRPPKERVLGIPRLDVPGADGGIAFPYGSLNELGPVAAVSIVVDGKPAVVFWDEFAQGAMAFLPNTEGRTLTFTVEGSEIRDVETGSVWSVDGRARSGLLEGATLEPIEEAYVVYWFAWAAFHPQTELWRPL